MVKARHHHRMFLQAMLARRTILESTAIELYKRIMAAILVVEPHYGVVYPADAAGVLKFVNEASDVVAEVGMRVERTRDETSKGRWWYTLVNVDGKDEIAKSATDLAPLELSYFRELITGILDSYPACSLGVNAARSVAGNLQTAMNRSYAEEVLRALVSRGWLHRSKRGRYALGTRTLVELEDWLETEYSDLIFTCGGCHKIVTSGVACGNGATMCDTHFHQSCFATALRNPRGTCPGCKAPLAGMTMKPVGERTVPKSSDGDIGMFEKRRTGRKVGAQDEVDKDELESESEVNGSQRTPRKRAKLDQGSQSQRPEGSQRTPPPAASSPAPDSEDDDLYDEPPTSGRRR